MRKLNKDMDCYTLDKILQSYNWDDGFERPLEIIHHLNCELATALRAFYSAEGGIYLQDITLTECEPSPWLRFVRCLYERITNGCYTGKFVEFEIPLSKVQKYKLLKAAPDTPKIFLNDIAGSKNTDRCEQCAFYGDTSAKPKGESFCTECGAENTLIGEIDGAAYSLRCKNCGGYNVATTVFRPCYVNDTTPKEEFNRYSACQFRA